MAGPVGEVILMSQPSSNYTKEVTIYRLLTAHSCNMNLRSNLRRGQYGSSEFGWLLARQGYVEPPSITDSFSGGNCHFVSISRVCYFM